MQSVFEDALHYVSNFAAVDNVTFGLNAVFCVGLSTTYLIVIWLLSAFMKNRQPLKSPLFTAFVFVHNIVLSVGSGAMLLAMLFELYLDVRRGVPPFAFLCDIEGVSNMNTLRPGRVSFYLYVFYLSKFYEFIDTIVLVLKKKDLIFLHVYHHFITTTLAYISITRHVDVSWWSAVANLSVHTFMYYYYAVSLLGASPWWKKYLTEMQIGQFILDLASGVVMMWAMIYTGGRCGTPWPSAIFAQTVLFSFLLLFVEFFMKAYGAKGGPRAKNAAAAERKKQF